MKNEVLIVWNPGEFANELKRQFVKSRVVVSEEELEAELNRGPAVQGLILPAELAWKGRRYSDFYGLELVRRLRVDKRLLCPAVICSFFPENHFMPQGSQQPETGRTEQTRIFNLLKAPSHKLLLLPIDWRAGNKRSHPLYEGLAQALTPDLLDDVIESLCEVGGLLDEEIHRLKNKVIVTPEAARTEDDRVKEGARIREAVSDSFDRIGLLFPGDEHVAEIRKRLSTEIQSAAIDKNNLRAAVGIVSSFAGDLHRLVPSDSKRAVHPLAQKPVWKVLFIDDEEKPRKSLKESLEQRNICCITASSGEEALHELDEDRANWITVVIADYRLEDSRSGKWQSKQGYSILKEIFSNKPNMVAMFALTAAHRRALFRVQKEYNMKVQVYSKEDVLGSEGEGGINLFAENIRREGERMYDAVCSKPDLSSWEQTSPKSKFARPLKEYYRAHRLSLDYEQEERRIGMQAVEYVQSIARAFEKDEQPEEHDYLFQSELKRGPEDLESLAKFRIKLLGRRIAIGLYYYLGWERTEIAYAMQKPPILYADESDKRVDVNPFLTQHLAVSFERLPENLLVEERRWLAEDLEVDFDSNKKTAFKEIQETLTEFRYHLLKEDALPDSEDEDRQIRIQSIVMAKRELAKWSELARRLQYKGEFQRRVSESLGRIKANTSLNKVLRGTEFYELLRKYAGIEEPDYDWS